MTRVSASSAAAPTGTRASFVAPAGPEAYEVRYVLVEGDRTLVSRAITVR